MEKKSAMVDDSQPADWLNDPLPDYARPRQRKLFEVGGIVTGFSRDEALKVKAEIESDTKPRQRLH